MRVVCIFVAVATLAGAALAQGTAVSVGRSDYDSSLPVEITADQLQVDQNSGEATFTGNVVVGQGGMRMTGDVIDVTYTPGGAGEIQSLHARGSVTMTTPAEAAEADEAVYTLADGLVVMTGDVVLTQGQNAMAGEKLTVRLDDGTGVMEGRVRVIFRQQEGEQSQ